MLLTIGIFTFHFKSRETTLVMKLRSFLAFFTRAKLLSIQTGLEVGGKRKTPARKPLIPTVIA
jgi:hypothetical protein